MSPRSRCREPRQQIGSSKVDDIRIDVDHVLANHLPAGIIPSGVVLNIIEGNGGVTGASVTEADAMADHHRTCADAAVEVFADKVARRQHTQLK